MLQALLSNVLHKSSQTQHIYMLSYEQPKLALSSSLSMVIYSQTSQIYIYNWSSFHTKASLTLNHSHKNHCTYRQNPKLESCWNHRKNLLELGTKLLSKAQ